MNKNSSLQNLIAGEDHFFRSVEDPSSSITHHNKNCCEESRLWFLSYARSMQALNVSKYQLQPPTWLSQLFTWGPATWPLAWCQIFKEKTIDCGAFAALAREAFKAQGFEAHPAQVLLSYDETCTRHWKDLWKAGLKKVETRKMGESFPWTSSVLVRREVCILESAEGSAKIYDSTFGTWFEPIKRVGLGTIVSVRSECPRLLKWSDKILDYGKWVDT